jgi:hypothetical protein
MLPLTDLLARRFADDGRGPGAARNGLVAKTFTFVAASFLSPLFCQLCCGGAVVGPSTLIRIAWSDLCREGDEIADRRPRVGFSPNQAALAFSARQFARSNAF